MTTQQVPPGFEAPHAEWLRIGGPNFRDIYRCSVGPGFYRSQYWKLVKQAVLALKDFKCCRCTGNANQVHHLNYDWVGEDHLHPESLAAVCVSCHGLIEYARKAESLIPRISRRLSLCQGFMEDRQGCLNQNAAHVYARLLEYQDILAELRRLFVAKTFYDNPRISSEAEAEAFRVSFQRERQAYQERAESLVSTWSGSEKEKAARLPPLLEWKFKTVGCSLLRFLHQFHRGLRIFHQKSRPTPQFGQRERAGLSQRRNQETQRQESSRLSWESSFTEAMWKAFCRRTAWSWCESQIMLMTRTPFR